MYLAERPDLVVLDVTMPKLDGFELCSQIREDDPDVPILFLSAKSDVIDKKSGFRAGADDYVVKPFDEEELLLRVEALLRRVRLHAGEHSGQGDERHSGLMEPVCVGDLVIDPRRHEVSVEGRVILLTPKEFQILALLAESPGEVYTQEELVKNLWGDEYEKDSVSIPVYVRRIRKKIEKDPSNPQYLQTVWSVGYRLGL